MTTQANEPNQTPAQEPQNEGDAYQKLLREKQNWSDKAKLEGDARKAAEIKLQELETTRLKERDDQKGLAEMYQKKATELEIKLASIENEQQKSIKLTQVKREWEKLGLKDPGQAEKLMQLVNLEKIKYDPELKIVIGQEDEAKRIFEDFKPLFVGNLPVNDHSAPKGIPASISVDGYKQMLKDGSFNKMSKDAQKDYMTKLYQSQGLTVKK